MMSEGKTKATKQGNCHPHNQKSGKLNFKQECLHLENEAAADKNTHCCQVTLENKVVVYSKKQINVV